MIVLTMTAMKRMSMGVCFFAILVIFPTLVIGMTGAVHYAGLSTADFLSRVLITDHSYQIATLILLGLVGAAVSTSDAQLFALGTEFRSIIKGGEKQAMFRTRLAMLLFAIIAFIFSLLSSDQLVLLARVSFTGTGLLGPMVLNAVFQKNKVSKINIYLSGLALIVFILSLAGWFPTRIFKIQLDLLLFIILFSVMFINMIITRKPRAER